MLSYCPAGGSSADDGVQSGGQSFEGSWKQRYSVAVSSVQQRAEYYAGYLVYGAAWHGRAGRGGRYGAGAGDSAPDCAASLQRI